MTHYYTIITLMCIIAIMTILLPKRPFNCYARVFVLSIITIMTVIYIIREQQISRQIYAFFSCALH